MVAVAIGDAVAVVIVVTVIVGMVAVAVDGQVPTGAALFRGAGAAAAKSAASMPGTSTPCPVGFHLARPIPMAIGPCCMSVFPPVSHQQMAALPAARTLAHRIRYH